MSEPKNRLKTIDEYISKYPKNIQEILDLITPITDIVILTKSQTKRAFDPQILKKMIVNKEIIVKERIFDAIQHAKKIAAPFKYPREIEFVDVLPKTQSGKIKRKELREMEKKRKTKVKK